MNRLLAPLVGLLLAGTGATAFAGVLGTSVTGAIRFPGNSTNYFNSSNGYVPAGCQNSSTGSATVTVVNPTAEFCFTDGANRDTANFTDTTLTYTDVASTAQGSDNVTLTFTFTPGLVTGVSETGDNFTGTGATAVFANNVLTISIAAFSGTGSFAASYNLIGASAVPVPEPATISLMALAGLGIAGAARRRRG